MSHTVYHHELHRQVKNKLLKVIDIQLLFAMMSRLETGERGKHVGRKGHVS